MTTPDTPALELATLCDTLSAHLRKFHHLPYVHISQSVYADADLHIADIHNPAPKGACAVLLWAKTLVDPSIDLSVHGADDSVRTTVRAVGSMGPCRVAVWDVDRGDLYRWLDSTQRKTVISMGQLSAYVAAGSVEAVAQ